MNKKELKKAYQEGLITREQYANQLINLEEKPRERKEKRIYEAVSPEDFLKLLKVTRKIQHRIAFVLAYGSGLRVSEINKLLPENIDFKSKSIMIRQGKGGKDRQTFLSKYFKRVYLSYLPIKIGERGLSKAFLSNSIKAGFNSVLYVDKANRPRFKFHLHSLRHSFCVNSLKAGVPINAVQNLMGHANLSTTSRYSELKSQDAINQFLEKGL